MNETIPMAAVLGSLAQSGLAVRCLCSGEDGSFELWIENGQILSWESSEPSDLADLILRKNYSLWIRPLNRNFKKAGKSHSINALLDNLNLASPEEKPMGSPSKATAELRRKKTVDLDPSRAGRVKSEESAMEIAFTRGEKVTRVAGRSEVCDIIIKDPQASRKHCEIFFDGQKMHLKDLNSVNGTFLNQSQVHMAIAEAGDVLQIGDAQFLLTIHDSA